MCKITSTSRIFDKNWFPNPSPLEAPLTNPAISTKSIVECWILSGLTIFANSSSLLSGTGTIALFGSIVQNG